MFDKNNTYRQILRLFLPGGKEVVRVQEAIDFCRKINCREIMLFTGCFDSSPSFLTVEEVKAHTDNILKPAFETLQAAGLKVSLNILQTLGHLYFPDTPEYRAKFPFQERITLDGKGGGGACPIDEFLIEWVKKTYTVYAGLKPEYIFVDDDFRTVMKGGMTCFCPKHLELIGEKAGHAVSREEVVNAVLYEPDSPLRKIYFDVTTDGFVALAQIIHDTVKAVSPASRIGLMSACLPHGGAGIDLEKVILTLAGGDRPLLRPQVSLYYEVMLLEFPPLVFNPSLMRASLPENVEHFAELECTPYGPYGKSAAMTAAHAFALIMQGFPSQGFTFFDNLGHSLTESVALTKAFAENNSFFNLASSLIPEGNSCCGINTVVGKNVLRVRHARKGIADYFDDRELALNMTLCGLPLGTDKTSLFQVLTGDDLRTMEVSQIDLILKCGALMDVPALEALHDLGFGERIGIRAGDLIDSDDVGIEEYNFGFMDGANSSCFCQPLRYFYNDNVSRFVKLESDEKAEKWSIIRNCTHDAVAPGLLVRENEFGERFAVLPFTGDPLKKFTANYDRTRQLRRVFSYIARRPLPLTVRETAPYIWLLLNRTADNRLVAGVLNCSSDTIEELPLLAGSEFAKGIVQITCDGEKNIPLVSEVIPDPDGTGAILFNLKMTLKPLDFALLAAVE